MLIIKFNNVQLFLFTRKWIKRKQEIFKLKLKQKQMRKTVLHKSFFIWRRGRRSDKKKSGKLNWKSGAKIALENNSFFMRNALHHQLSFHPLFEDGNGVQREVAPEGMSGGIFNRLNDFCVLLNVKILLFKWISTPSTAAETTNLCNLNWNKCEGASKCASSVSAKRKRFVSYLKK